MRALSPGDRILTLNLAYGTKLYYALSIWLRVLNNSQDNSVGATKKLLRHMQHTHGVTVDEVVIQFPVCSGSEVSSLLAKSNDNFFSVYRL